ncbi:MAG: HlyD family secretion protein [Candidatus Cryptobacteroides sp.]
MNKIMNKMAVNTATVVLIVAGLAWIASAFIHFGGEWTENAQVRRDIVTQSARVQGFIKEVRFDAFQQVHKGDTLVLIEDVEYRLRVSQARADLENAMVGRKAMGTSVSATDNNLAVSDAALEELRIQLGNAEREYRRYEGLLAKDAVTRQQYEGVKTQYEALRAKVQTMETQKRTTALVKTEQQQRLSQGELGIDICRAALEMAELNLSYTVVTAECDGFVSDKFIREGELVMPGTALLAVVSSGEPWVIANYREKQLSGISPGSEVEIKVDAMKGRKFVGRVAAIAGATGAAFSPMAPDNSTGNYVKVEQRVPVKIVFDSSGDLSKLASGMSVECKVLD